MIIFFALTISFATFLFIVYGYPLLYRGSDDFLVNKWFKFNNLTFARKQKIRKYSLSTIRMIYESNKEPSKKKILFIAVILNFMYAIIMYPNVPLPSAISTKMYFTGLLFFIIGAYVISICL